MDGTLCKHSKCYSRNQAHYWVACVTGKAIGRRKVLVIVGVVHLSFLPATESVQSCTVELDNLLCAFACNVCKLCLCMWWRYFCL